MFSRPLPHPVQDFRTRRWGRRVTVEISDGSVARAGDGGLDARLAAAHVFLEFPLFCRPRLSGRLLAIGVGIFYTGGSGRVNLLSPLPDTAVAERVETL